MFNVLTAFTTRIDTWTGFQRWGPDANPVIQQTKRRGGRVSLRRALWLAFGIGLAGAAITSAQFLAINSDRLSPFDWALLALGWSLYGLTPLAAAIWAVRHTRQVRRSARFDALYLTPLPNFKLIEAFAFETLYTMRYTLIVLIGIMPALIIKSMHVVFVVDTQFRVRYSYNSYLLPAEIDPPSVASIVIPALFALALAVGVWGLTLLATITGVHMGLLRRSSELAFIGAPSAILLTMICPCLVCSWTVPAAIIPEMQACGALIAALLPLFIAIFPFLLAINGVLSTAKRWGR